MGIQGLLQVLKSIGQKTHVQQFAGQRVGIDAYGWLHRAAYACAAELAQGRPTDVFVKSCMLRVEMLLHYKVIPVLIFDGAPLPSKRKTEEERQQRRDFYTAQAAASLRNDDHFTAYRHYQKCVDVTPEMALQFIKALRAINVEYIVAPYEADAQLGYLARENYIAAVISEDSDLLLFGCQRVLYKMDKFGEGVLIDQKDFANCLELDLQNWTLDQLRRMCILSGCDYLDSISGIGLKTANKLLIRYKTVQNVVTHMRKKMMDVPRDYEDLFLQAENTFKYQRVVHPGSLELTHVTPVPDAVDISQMDYIGPILEPHVARGIALGNINPNTMACMDNYDPNATMVVSSKEVVETDADSCAAPCANTEPSSTRLTIPKPMWIAPKAFKNRFSAFSATSNLAPLQNQASILQFLKPSEGASRGFKAPAQAPVAPPASPPAGDVPITPLRRYPASDAQPRISKQSAAIIGSFARKRTFEQASSDHAEQSEDQSESAAQASMAEEENDEDVFLSPELAQEALMPNETADPSSAVNLFGPTWLEDMRTYLVHQHEEACEAEAVEAPRSAKKPRHEDFSHTPASGRRASSSASSEKSSSAERVQVISRFFAPTRTTAAAGAAATATITTHTFAATTTTSATRMTIAETASVTTVTKPKPASLAIPSQSSSTMGLPPVNHQHLSGVASSSSASFLAARFNSSDLLLSESSNVDLFGEPSLLEHRSQSMSGQQTDEEIFADDSRDSSGQAEEQEHLASSSVAGAEVRVQAALDSAVDTSQRPLWDLLPTQTTAPPRSSYYHSNRDSDAADEEDQATPDEEILDDDMAVSVDLNEVYKRDRSSLVDKGDSIQVDNSQRASPMAAAASFSLFSATVPSHAQSEHLQSVDHAAHPPSRDLFKTPPRAAANAAVAAPGDSSSPQMRWFLTPPQRVSPAASRSPQRNASSGSQLDAPPQPSTLNFFDNTSDLRNAFAHLTGSEPSVVHAEVRRQALEAAPGSAVVRNARAALYTSARGESQAPISSHENSSTDTSGKPSPPLEPHALLARSIAEAAAVQARRKASPFGLRPSLANAATSAVSPGESSKAIAMGGDPERFKSPFVKEHGRMRPIGLARPGSSSARKHSKSASLARLPLRNVSNDLESTSDVESDDAEAVAGQADEAATTTALRSFVQSFSYNRSSQRSLSQTPPRQVQA